MNNQNETSYTIDVGLLVDNATTEEIRKLAATQCDDVVIDEFLTNGEQRLRLRENLPGASTGTSKPPAREQTEFEMKPQRASSSEVHYELLKFLVTDARSRPQLQGLQDGCPSFDRDEAVLFLWRTLMECDESYVSKAHFSVRYHQLRLFAWFVDRYDLSRARRIFTESRALCEWIQFIPLVAAAAAVWFANSAYWPWLLVGSGYALPAVIWCMNRMPQSDGRQMPRLPVIEFLQSLVPRLAGTAAAGAALLLSNDKLLGFLSQKVRFAALVPVLIACAYLALEITQRVHPRLRWRELINRVGTVVCLALSHAIAIVIVLLPAIRFVLGQPGHRFSPAEILVFATAVFVAGLILNVIWAEDPITRPL